MNTPLLWPAPREVSWGEPVEVTAKTAVHTRGDVPAWVRERAEALDFPVRLETADVGLPAGGYELRIDHRGALVRAADAEGLRNGVATAAQAAAEDADGLVPAVRIRDWPDFPHRGLMLDISRCKVPTLQTLQEIAGLLGDLKFNQLQLYTEHTFAFPGHEVVWGDASPLTAEDVRELDATCRNHGIELVPNFNSFGHVERWLKHPEYLHLAECPDGFTTFWGEKRPCGSTLRPDAASLAFVRGLHDDLLPHFSSRLFNVGCDETWELGQGWSRPLCEAKGKHRVYLEFLLGLHQSVAARGLRLQFWADILLHAPELAAELPRDIIPLVWGYEAAHPFDDELAKFSSHGLETYVCPGTSAWNSLGGRTANQIANQRLAAAAGLRHGAKGYLVTDWGDGGHHQPYAVSLPGWFWAASQAWNGASAQEGDLADAIDLYHRDPELDTYSPGAVLLELGRAVERFAHRPSNSSPVCNILFAGAAWAADKIREDEVRAALAFLRGVRERVPDNADDDLADDLRLSADLQIAGCGRWLVERGLEKPGPWRRVLSELIGRYEDNWLVRNRVGGLHESSVRLRGALAAIR